MENLIAGRSDVDMPVAGAKNASRNAGRMIVAGLFGHLAGDQPARGLEIEHRDLRRQQRAFDPLALARNLALQEGDENAHRAEDPGREISDRDADAHRPLPREAGNRHQSAHSLRDLIKTRTVAIRPALSETGDTGVDQTRVD